MAPSKQEIPSSHIHLKKYFKHFNQKTHAPGKKKSNSTKEFIMKTNSSIPLASSKLNVPPRGDYFQVLKICFF